MFKEIRYFIAKNECLCTFFYKLVLKYVEFKI